ncbi:MAG TPA: zinc-ribbon domain-containing protein [Polyangiaceae bacterium]|jgi:predicted Zn finger-like uncharacterized protein|nr:zinc-ribbon domain-containing protein [Polyangiaceae bacterium]
MNIACSSCPAKYAVPDEKVRGRKVRITCKRCGAAIIVDGTAVGATGTGDAPARPPQNTMAGGADAPVPSGTSPGVGQASAAASAAAAIKGDSAKVNVNAATAPGAPHDAENDVATTMGGPGDLAAAAAFASGSADAKLAAPNAAALDPSAPKAEVKAAAVPKAGAAPATAAGKPLGFAARPLGAAAKPLASLGKAAAGPDKAAAGADKGASDKGTVEADKPVASTDKGAVEKPVAGADTAAAGGDKAATGGDKAAAFPKPFGGTGKLAGLGKVGAAATTAKAGTAGGGATPGKAATTSVGGATPGKSATAAVTAAKAQPPVTTTLGGVGGPTATPIGGAATATAGGAAPTAVGGAGSVGATTATQAAARAVVPRAGAAAARAVAPSALPERTWTVAVTDDDHHEMALSQIVDAYAAESIDADTFIWREGMQDWLMPFEIAEIATALRARKLTPRTNTQQESALGAGPIIGEDPASGAWREPGRWDRDEPSPPEEPNFDDVTVAMEAPKARALLQAVTSEEAATAARPKSDDGPTMIAPKADEPTAIAGPFAVTPELLGFGLDDDAEAPVPMALSPVAPLAPNVEGTRGDSIVELASSLEREPEKLPFQFAPSAVPPRAQMKSGTNETDAGAARDLFSRGGLADEEPSSALDSDDSDEAKARTGARNESSVLFSLDQLARPEAKPSAVTPKKRDEAALLLGGTAASAGGAPVANMGGGGLFGQTNMAAPDFTAPSPPSVAPGKRRDSASPTAEKKGSRGAGFWIGVLAALAACGGGAYFLSRSQATPTPAPTAEPTMTAAPTAPATTEPVASAAANEVPATSGATPAASGAPGTSASAAGSAAAPGGSAAPGASGSAAAPGAVPATGAATPTGATTPTQPKTTQPSSATPKAAAAAAEPEAPAAGPDFDKDAAMAALATAGANSESQCATEEGPHGTGKVAVTFANSGRATNALVSGDFAGSALGGCVARIFRAAHVPPFGGESVRVSKTVRIP